MPEAIVSLISTLHDPNGLMPDIIDQCFPAVRNLYSDIVIVTTKDTCPETLEKLSPFNIILEQTGGPDIGESRRRSLNTGLQKTEADFFHYCDFDRVLHWGLKHLDELKNLISSRIKKQDFLIIGRTDNAFNTHPPSNIKTEMITNSVVSSLLKNKVDVTAGSCSISRPAAKKILLESGEPSNATDAEWPLIVFMHKNNRLSLGHIEVEGLEFENPTFYGPEALKLANTTENWAARVKLAHDSIKSALKIYNNKFNNGG